jgi:hypothetical protein
MAAGLALSLAAVFLLAGAVRVAAATPPSLTVSPGGPYKDGQTISVSVGANGYFTPHSRVNILECADPGGSAANLPKDITSCDGNSIQGSTILVGADGSFSDSAYPVYLLPSQTLGEQSNYKPVCNQSNYCVLYVGQNQNDFTAPKVFSAAFLVSPASGSSTSTSTAGGSSTATSTPASSSSASSAAAGAALGGSAGAADPSTAAAGATGSLADTGPPAGVVWLLASGLGLLLAGAGGRRLILRAAR